MYQMLNIPTTSRSEEYSTLETLDPSKRTTQRPSTGTYAPPSQPLYRPNEPIQFGFRPNRKHSPLRSHVQLLEDRVDLHLALLKDLLFPHLRPGLGGVTKLLRERIWALASNRRAAVRAKYDRARSRVKQFCQTSSEFKLFLLVEKVEEERGVDGRDAPSQFGQTVHRRNRRRWAGWYRSGG